MHIDNYLANESLLPRRETNYQILLIVRHIQQLAAMREEVLYVIFLDLTKAYDTLDRSRCLEILEGYGVGPNARRLLNNYWRRLTIVARAGGGIMARRSKGREV